VIIILINNKQLSEKELTQIFNMLKHPLRRAILKQLSKGPRAYSQILKNLNIQESSVLNYHLREMGDLMIKKDVNGKYELNEVGKICLQLVLKVKEKEDIRRFNKLQLVVVQNLIAIGIYVGALTIFWIEYFRGYFSLLGTTFYTFMTPLVLISVYYIRKSIHQRNIYKFIFIIGGGLALGWPIWVLINFILIGATWSPFYNLQGISRTIILISTIAPSCIVAGYIFYKWGKKRDFRPFM